MPHVDDGAIIAQMGYYRTIRRCSRDRWDQRALDVPTKDFRHAYIPE